MNKSQVICPIAAVLLPGIVLENRQARWQRRNVVSEVGRRAELHSPRIAALLTSMRGGNVAVFYAAAYEKLQTL